MNVPQSLPAYSVWHRKGEVEEGEPHICSSSLQIGSVVSAVLVSKRINNMHKKHTVHTHTRAHAHTRPRDNRDNNKTLKKTIWHQAVTVSRSICRRGGSVLFSCPVRLCASSETLNVSRVQNNTGVTAKWKPANKNALRSCRPPTRGVKTSRRRCHHRKQSSAVKWFLLLKVMAWSHYTEAVKRQLLFLHSKSKSR